MRVYMLDRYRRRRAEASRALGGQCRRCGSISDLEFDHVDPTTKVRSIAGMWSYSEQRFWTEVWKCQLLCTPCHIDKSKADHRPWQHGTEFAWDKHSCRCAECTAGHEAHLERDGPGDASSGVCGNGQADVTFNHGVSVRV